MVGPLVEELFLAAFTKEYIRISTIRVADLGRDRTDSALRKNKDPYPTLKITGSGSTASSNTRGTSSIRKSADSSSPKISRKVKGNPHNPEDAHRQSPESNLSKQCFGTLLY